LPESPDFQVKVLQWPIIAPFPSAVAFFPGPPRTLIFLKSALHTGVRGAGPMDPSFFAPQSRPPLSYYERRPNLPLVY